ncbi:MAG: DUF3794 domain-containing protein [Firmicutes bacterium]|nr:DUF3794 domain-containing protein [Bacillota bacterium]
MELVFQDSQLEYLSRILCETVSQEQTADVIIPDSYPDAERVVDAFGTLLIRSEECMAGSASVAGVVQAGVLFVSEQGQVECVQAQIPFSVRRDFSAEQESCTLQCRCTLRSVDARPLNSRKLLVRVGISCTLCVYAPKKHLCYDIAEPAENLQLKRVELPLQMPLDLGERSFGLNEELELPNGKPAISRLLKCLYRTQLQEQRVVGSKAVFKGEMIVHALYESDDETLHMHEWSVPFSQYAELERESDDSDLQTMLTLTSAETEPDGQIDSRRLLTSVNILAQCLVSGMQRIRLIEDAFCTDAELKPQFDDWQISGVLDRQTFRETAITESDEPAESIVDACMYPEEASKQRTGEKTQIELPLNCNILYYDAEGKLRGKTLRPSVQLETELSENAACGVTEVVGGELFCAAGSGGIALRAPVSVTVESSAVHSLHAVCGGEITPLEEESGRKPALILRRTDGEEEIWQIAKDCRTSVRSIQDANDLKGTSVPENTLLLIPM